MAKSNDSKVTFHNIISKLLDGLTKHFAGQTLLMGGVTVKQQDLATGWQAYLAAVTDADTARAVWLGKVDVAQKLAPGVRAQVNAAHDFVRNQFGAASPTLADFGMTPRRTVATRTVAEKAQSIVKSLATRVVRHTMGPKQKAALHGAAPTAPAVPTVPATPAVKATT